jgi:broad specificity phosphatase PhoE
VATRLVLIRHAAVDTRSRLCGSLNLSLSPAGRADLNALLRRPARAEAPVALFTSTLRRATEVACELGRVWGLEPEPADWAREIDCGDVEGMPLEHLQQHFPDLWTRNEAQLDDAFAWPGGETYAHFRARVMRGLDFAAARHPTGRVVVVTHAGAVSQVLGVIKGRGACVWQPDRPRPLTATEVLWENGGPRAVLSFSDPDWY